MKNYTLIANFGTEFEAKIVEMKLAESGIPSFLKAPDGYPPFDYTRGINVYVNPEDFAKATEVLKSEESDLSANANQ